MKRQLLAIAAFAAAATVQAATIGVNFTNGDLKQQIEPSTEAGLFPRDNWNNTTNGVSGTLGSLVDSDGTITAASIDWSADSFWGDAAADADAEAGIGDAQLARGYLDDNAPGAGWTVTGIPYATYSAVLYLCSNVNGDSYQPFTINGTEYSAAGTKHRYENPNWDTSNIIIVSGLSSNLTVSGLPRDDVLRGSVGGFQIIEDIPGALPEILDFAVDSTNVLSGETVMLSWLSMGADTLSIDQGVGDVTGLTSTQVVVNAATTYTLTASNANGSTNESAQQVTLITTLPVINSFTASETVVSTGQTVTLSWSVGNETGISIDQGIGDVTGLTSTQVVINADITYTLTASNPNGSTNTSVGIVIGDPGDGLIAHYTFDVDGTATVGADATLGSAASITNEARVGGGALALSGTPSPDTEGNDGAVGGDTFTWGSDTRTIAFFVKAAAGDRGDNGATMISLGAKVANGTRFDVRFVGTDGDDLRLELQGYGANTDATIADGAWHHVALVVPAVATLADTQYYLDGAYVGNFVGTGAILTADGPLRMGDGFQDTGRDFKGLLDDVRLYDRELDAAEIADLANMGGAPVPVEDLVISGPVSGGTGVVLSWTGQNGKAYGVETNSDLIIGDWQSFTSNVPGAGGIITITNTIGPDQTFYQVISE